MVGCWLLNRTVQLRKSFASGLIWLALTGNAMAATRFVIDDDVLVFRDAFAASDVAKVEALLADLRKAAKPLPRDPDGKTLLHYAVQVYSSERLRFIRMLLKAGVDVNALADEALTPLHFAARFDCPPCARELIAAGAKVNALDSQGWSPIFQASRELLPILIGAGAEIHLRDPEGNVPLHRNPKPEFIAAGIDVNVKNNAGLTPLHFAALAGNNGSIEMLVGQGASLSARTTETSWYRASIMSAAFGKGDEIPKGATALDLAKLQHSRTKWNTSRYKPGVELLEKLQREARR